MLSDKEPKKRFVVSKSIQDSPIARKAKDNQWKSFYKSVDPNRDPHGVFSRSGQRGKVDRVMLKQIR